MFPISPFGHSLSPSEQSSQPVKGSQSAAAAEMNSSLTSLDLANVFVFEEPSPLANTLLCWRDPLGVALFRKSAVSVPLLVLLTFLTILTIQNILCAH